MERSLSIADHSVNPDSRLFLNRKDFLNSFNKISSYLEVGVFAGDYADLVIDILSPTTISLLDTFDCDDEDAGGRFSKEGHLDFVKNKYAQNDSVEIVVGHSHKKLLEKIDSNEKYDYIYIDANHQIAGVYGDLLLSSKLLSQDGVIGINDFTTYFWWIQKDCGVIDAVAHFLDTFSNWEIFAYSLNSAEGYTGDVYLRRKQSQGESNPSYRRERAAF